MSDESKPLVKSTEIAKRYGVTSRTILNLVDRGDIPGIRVGSEWRFDPCAVKEAFEARTAERLRSRRPEP